MIDVIVFTETLPRIGGGGGGGGERRGEGEVPLKVWDPELI